MHALDALGNPVRREILVALRRAPLPVGAIADRFAVSRPAISRHLQVLSDAGLVEMKEHGAQNVYEVRLAGFRAVREFLDGFWDTALQELERLAREEGPTSASPPVATLRAQRSKKKAAR